MRYLLLRKRHPDVRRPLHIDVCPSQTRERARKKKFAAVSALVWRMYLSDGYQCFGVERGRPKLIKLWRESICEGRAHPNNGCSKATCGRRHTVVSVSG